MYLKNGLISFLKVKNVILLILGIFSTAASASNMIELIVYYFGDWFTIIHANSTLGSVFLFIIGVLMIVCSRGSRRLINDACFFSSYFDEETEQRFYGCVIQDALACCSQGLAFELSKPRKYPKEYPAEGSVITITGDFDFVKEEDGASYPIIRNAKLLNE